MKLYEYIIHYRIIGIPLVNTQVISMYLSLDFREYFILYNYKYQLPSSYNKRIYRDALVNTLI
jgi:hypothetical protein